MSLVLGLEFHAVVVPLRELPLAQKFHCFPKKQVEICLEENLRVRQSFFKYPLYIIQSESFLQVMLMLFKTGAMLSEK